MLKSKIALAVLFAVLTGCSSYTLPKFDPVLYPRVHSAYDLTLYWNVRNEGSGVAIPGFIKNTRFAYIRDLELTATLFDDGGKKLNEATFIFFPRQIEMDEPIPFTLNIGLTNGQKPAKIRFFYRYRLPERDYGDTPYSYTFEEELR